MKNIYYFNATSPNNHQRSLITNVDKIFSLDDEDAHDLTTLMALASTFENQTDLINYMVDNDFLSDEFRNGHISLYLASPKNTENADYANVIIPYKEYRSIVFNSNELKKLINNHITDYYFIKGFYHKFEYIKNPQLNSRFLTLLSMYYAKRYKSPEADNDLKDAQKYLNQFLDKYITGDNVTLNKLRVITYIIEYERKNQKLPDRVISTDNEYSIEALNQELYHVQELFNSEKQSDNDRIILTDRLTDIKNRIKFIKQYGHAEEMRKILKGGR